MSDNRRNYLPAAGRDWALPVYDPLMKLLGADAARIPVLDRAAIRSGDRVLDIGCGTGTFAMLIQCRHPGADVRGLDPDPHALVRARRKAARAGVHVSFDEGFSDALPYADASFDRVFSTFMFHHLGPEQKRKTLAEVRRVLAPGGSFHLLDFVRPDTSASHSWSHLLHRSKHLADNSSSRIIGLLEQAGFVNVVSRGSGAMLFGLLCTADYQALST